MKVLIVNASPHRNGNTSIALEEMIKVFRNEGVETELLNIGTQSIRGCIACNSCAKNGKCVFDDAVNKAAPLLKEADGLVIASPVYYASANATLIAFLDRLFYLIIIVMIYLFNYLFLILCLKKMIFMINMHHILIMIKLKVFLMQWI